MPKRFLTFLWAACSLAVAGLGALTWSRYGLSLPVISFIVFILMFTVLGIFVDPARKLMAQALSALRSHPALYWLLLLVIIVLWIARWIVIYQPTSGWPVSAIEWAYFFTGIWSLLFLLAYSMTREQVQSLARGLSSSKWTGILITLTTIPIVFFAAEAYLRLFYITTDGYGFTAMNYHWYKNFGWAQDNSLGYRDHEPRQPAPGLTRIAVLGDSFAMGHGIDDLNDTFAQLLEQRLGDCCDINLIAESGWDTDLQLPFLEQYPYLPDILILSYYLNDIDYLLTGTERDPNANFAFIDDPNLSWFVLNFFVPNYLYYNLLQFTSQTRASGFIGDLTSAYDDPIMWDEQRFRLNQLIDWTEARDIKLIVLIWPHITAIDLSGGAVRQVAEVFASRGISVVDMSDVLREYPVQQLIVNRFDAHPSILSHRLAADGLEPLLRAALSQN